jgi:hypothetical protein
MSQPSYSPHQVQSGTAVSSEYPMGNTPPVPSGSIPPHLQGSAVTNGQLGDVGAAQAAVSSAMSGHGQGVFDVPKYNDGGPGMSGS